MRCRRLLELLTLALTAAGCAKAMPPAPEVVRAAAALASYSGNLRVSVRGADLRGRSRALVAFRRPDALRIEIPGPAGARLLAVVAGGQLTAVLPSERAVLEQDASPEQFEALLGIALAPEELMDLLVGVSPPKARDCRVHWGKALPRRIETVLADGTRLTVGVDEAEGGMRLPDLAFEPPAHQGYRPVDADEARRLLGGR
jgi:hypothetical protein